MPLYFAYGPLMDLDALVQGSAALRPVGVARLPRHRLFITRDGDASVVRSSHDQVHGVVWDLTFGDLSALERVRHLASGRHAKISQPVVMTGGARRALLHVATSMEPGAPRPGEIEAMLASARRWGLPASCGRELARLAAKPGELCRAAASVPLGLPVSGVRPDAPSDPRSGLAQMPVRPRAFAPATSERIRLTNGAGRSTGRSPDEVR